ncbi:hypothetical protein DFH08DRAFT_822929 [Mycena albidolilacea]|uniref:Uncharacterized protein n=1 Tax=Mycena albidolilacea TaxID=1033008 RepID=A0AAD7EC55_9AGAR|nr:hypothetical protein DFH08DRAFT_822929 [Mycena albidolilacea]
MVAWVVLWFPGSTRNETVLVLNLSWFVIALGNIHTSRISRETKGRLSSWLRVKPKPLSKGTLPKLKPTQPVGEAERLVARDTNRRYRMGNGNSIDSTGLYMEAEPDSSEGYTQIHEPVFHAKNANFLQNWYRKTTPKVIGLDPS